MAKKDLTEHPILTYVFGGWVFLVICLQTYSVFSRNVLNTSTMWIDDLQRLNFIWLIWICGALAYGGRGLIALDLVQSKLHKKPRVYHSMTMLLTLIELLFGAVFSWLSVSMIRFQFSSGETVPALEIPLALVNLGFAIGCVIILVFAIRKTIRVALDIYRATPVEEETLQDVLAKGE